VVLETLIMDGVAGTAKEDMAGVVGSTDGSGEATERPGARSRSNSKVWR